jgi:uncharacterized Ntn-hydrolase superfamily protein
MTFSITARAPDTGEFGIAISSSSPAVAARCVHLRSGIGGVASQNVTDPVLGQVILDALAAGASADTALQSALAATPFGDWRQLAVVPRAGQPVAHTGAKGLGIHAVAIGADAVAAGNMLASDTIPQRMLDGFAVATGSLADRLLAALTAGLDAGGEAGPVHSAGLVVMRGVSWPIVDLRVDWSNHPIADLKYLWDIYAPQVEAYVGRALDPRHAPSFGVAGDP